MNTQENWRVFKWLFGIRHKEMHAFFIFCMTRPCVFAMTTGSLGTTELDSRDSGSWLRSGLGKRLTSPTWHPIIFLGVWGRFYARCTDFAWALIFLWRCRNRALVLLWRLCANERQGFFCGIGVRCGWGCGFWLSCENWQAFLGQVTLIFQRGRGCCFFCGDRRRWFFPMPPLIWFFGAIGGRWSRV